LPLKIARNVTARGLQDSLDEELEQLGGARRAAAAADDAYNSD
jgi:hypothetical protein